MRTTGLLGLGVLALLAQPPCTKKEPPSAKDDMKGKVVFSEGSFDDAKKYKTGEEFEKANKTVQAIAPAVPEAHLSYYSAFSEPLGANQYLVEVYDRTEGGSAPVKVYPTDAKDATTQVTAGWKFDIPQWPPPTDAEKLVANDVWLKPGHAYEVVIAKPLARGSFTVADVPAPSPTPTPVAAKPAKPGKKKK